MMDQSDSTSNNLAAPLMIARELEGYRNNAPHPSCTPLDILQSVFPLHFADVALFWQMLTTLGKCRQLGSMSRRTYVCWPHTWLLVHFLAGHHWTLGIGQGRWGHFDLSEPRKRRAKSMYQKMSPPPKWYFLLIFCLHKRFAMHLDSFSTSNAYNQCSQSSKENLASRLSSEAFPSPCE